MMTRQQYLLVKLAEECSELAKNALKAAQFGINTIEPGQHLKNAERLRMEYVDVVGIAWMLESDGVNLNFTPTEIYAKIDKVENYYRVSQDEGQVK